MNISADEKKMLEVLRRNGVSPEEIIIYVEDDLSKILQVLSKIKKNSTNSSENAVIESVYNSYLKKLLSYSSDRYDNGFYKESEKI